MLWCVNQSQTIHEQFMNDSSTMNDYQSLTMHDQLMEQITINQLFNLSLQTIN